LPDGCFSPYSPGTRTNVVFFTKGEPTERVWTYDARTGVPSITKKDRPLMPGQFAEFERCYGDDPHGHGQRHIGDSASDRWRSFTLKEIEKQDYHFDSLKWLREKADPEREDLDLVQLCDKIIGHLRKAIECVEALKADIMTWTCYAKKYNQPVAALTSAPEPAAAAQAALAPMPEKRVDKKSSRKASAA
jgi:type I restriction enzyme M protein